ncbi:MAG: hypothetical protein PHR06_05600 [Candidatus Cloacimonetes bacterium]|nr:hypothetical protein [Candidatus Cloacimonadota bacterium]
MYLCPECKNDLKPYKLEGGMGFYCVSCKKVYITMPVLKKMDISPNFIHNTLTAAKTSMDFEGECPYCDKATKKASFESEDKTINFWVCNTCQLFILDEDNVSLLPPRTDSEQELEAVQLALGRIEAEEKKYGISDGKKRKGIIFNLMLFIKVMAVIFIIFFVIANVKNIVVISVVALLLIATIIIHILRKGKQK